MCHAPKQTPQIYSVDDPGFDSTSKGKALGLRFVASEAVSLRGLGRLY